MDKSTCHTASYNFFKRLFGESINVDADISQEEKDTCEPDDFGYGLEITDTATGRKYFLVRCRMALNSGNLPEGTWGFAAWFHKDVPGTWDSPPDVDTVGIDESPSLYVVLFQVARDIFDYRLEYAHQAFGEDDHT